jgi:hypothetical protein
MITFDIEKSKKKWEPVIEKKEVSLFKKIK